MIVLKQLKDDVRVELEPAGADDAGAYIVLRRLSALDMDACQAEAQAVIYSLAVAEDGLNRYGIPGEAIDLRDPADMARLAKIVAMTEMVMRAGVEIVGLMREALDAAGAPLLTDDGAPRLVPLTLERPDITLLLQHRLYFLRIQSALESAEAVIALEKKSFARSAAGASTPSAGRDIATIAGAPESPAPAPDGDGTEPPAPSPSTGRAPTSDVH